MHISHWTKEGGIYHTRFRLADSVPQTKLREWLEERREILEKAAKEGRKFTKVEQKRLSELYSEKIEQYLDAGYGSCYFQQDKIAKIIAETLMIFNEKRYALHAWCIMPNHVHVIVQPHGDHPLCKILHSWKSYTANEANKILGRSGPFWQIESFDHLIRNQESLERTVEYVWRNPEEAGLQNWEWRWRIT